MWILYHLFMSAGKFFTLEFPVRSLEKNTFQYVNLHTNRIHNHSTFSELKTKLLKAFFWRHKLSVTTIDAKCFSHSLSLFLDLRSSILHLKLLNENKKSTFSRFTISIQ